MLLSRELAAGGAPDERQLIRLQAAGFRSLVDLRADGGSDRLPPDAEERKAGELGMAYRRHPIRPENLGPEDVDTVRGLVGGLPAPVFVHCRDGVFAGALALMLLGDGLGLDGDETLRRGERAGWVCEKDDLREAVRNYVDRRRRN